MQRPVISVIITCYNQAYFLGEAIESVLTQTYPHSEIIVVDDGSTDNPSEIAARYPGVRYIRQKNRGVSSARNTGHRESKGRYLVFLDADDRLLPPALETGLACLEAHPECAYVYGHVRLIDSAGAPLPTPPQYCVEGEPYLALLRRNDIWSPGQVMYREDVVASVAGFKSLIDSCADFELNLRITRNFAVRCHGREVLEYRVHGGNTSCNSMLMLRAVVTVYRAQRKYVRRNKGYEEAYRDGLRYCQGHYGELAVEEVRAHVKARRWRQAIKDMLVLLWYYPRGVVIHAGRKLYYSFFAE